MIDTRPVRRVDLDPPGDDVDLDRWPHTIPAVRQRHADGLELAPVTVLSVRTAAGSRPWSRPSRWRTGSRLEDNPTTGRASEPEFHAMSHGESFLADPERFHRRTLDP